MGDELLLLLKGCSRSHVIGKALCHLRTKTRNCSKIYVRFKTMPHKVAVAVVIFVSSIFAL